MCAAHVVFSFQNDGTNKRRGPNSKRLGEWGVGIQALVVWGAIWRINGSLGDFFVFFPFDIVEQRWPEVILFFFLLFPAYLFSIIIMFVYIYIILPPFYFFLICYNIANF